MWSKFYSKQQKRKSVALYQQPSKSFDIISKLGEGGFGKVYFGTHRDTNQALAIKEVIQDPKFINLEGDISSQMNHPNIVKFHEIYYVHKGNTKYCDRLCHVIIAISIIRQGLSSCKED